MKRLATAAQTFVPFGQISNELPQFQKQLWFNCGAQVTSCVGNHLMKKLVIIAALCAPVLSVPAHADKGDKPADKTVEVVSIPGEMVCKIKMRQQCWHFGNHCSPRPQSLVVMWNEKKGTYTRCDGDRDCVTYKAIFHQVVFAGQPAGLRISIPSMAIQTSATPDRKIFIESVLAPAYADLAHESCTSK